MVLLDSGLHRNLRVDAGRANRYGANAASVIPREFSRLVAHYPIFFSKTAEGSQFEPVALLGFERAENLYLIDGQWDATCVPMQIQRLPFALAPRTLDGDSQLDIAIDMSAPHVQNAQGERLFSEDGQASPYLKNMSALLATLLAGSREGYAFTQRLAELNLIESVQVDITFVNGTTTKLEGLYWIAAAVLKGLPAAELAALRDREYLEWMYLQMASLAHMSTLVARKNKKLSALVPGDTGAPATAGL